MQDHKENYFPLRPQETNRLQRRNSMPRNDQLYEIFIDICQRLDSQSQQYLRKVIPIDENKDLLMQTDQIILLNYIKQIVVFLVKSKQELESQSQSGDMKEYESMIQKLESDVRTHIRVEQQLRLYAETAQQKIEDMQSDRVSMEQQLCEMRSQLQSCQIHVNQLQSQLYYEKLNKKSRQVTEPSHNDSTSPLRKTGNQTSRQSIQVKEFEKSPIRKHSSPLKKHETKVSKQPMLIKQQQPYLGRIENLITSYRSISQDQQTYKKYKN